MDYHFLRAEKHGSAHVQKGGAMRLLVRFLPLFFLAAFLPVLIGFVVSPPGLSFLTRADETGVLRVWVEPANMIMSQGATSEVSLVAQFDGEEKLIPEISVTLENTDNIFIENKVVAHRIPFSGRVELGRVQVRAERSGQAQIIIPKDGVAVTAFPWPLEINTGSANVMVR